MFRIAPLSTRSVSPAVRVMLPAFPTQVLSASTCAPSRICNNSSAWSRMSPPWPRPSVNVSMLPSLRVSVLALIITVPAGLSLKVLLSMEAPSLIIKLPASTEISPALPPPEPIDWAEITARPSMTIAGALMTILPPFPAPSVEAKIPVGRKVSPGSLEAPDTPSDSVATISIVPPCPSAEVVLSIIEKSERVIRSAFIAMVPA
jgi:hypothetical protein